MSIIGLLILIADIWAILQIVQRKGGNGTKALWIVVILLLPIVGLILWYLFGRKK